MVEHQSKEERFCADCGHSWEQHSKGPAKANYCRHCPCPEWVELRPSKPQFCRYCGAGVGEFRRIGEGTCEKCDPEGVAANRKRNEASRPPELPPGGPDHPEVAGTSGHSHPDIPALVQRLRD